MQTSKTLFKNGIWKFTHICWIGQLPGSQMYAKEEVLVAQRPNGFEATQKRDFPSDADDKRGSGNAR